MTAPPLAGVDNFVPMVMGGLENAATMHHCHTPEIAFTSPATATGIWAMEDLLIFGDGTGTARRRPLPRDLRETGRHLADQNACI